MSTLRDRLRSVPSVTGTAPPWDPETAPEHPRDLFVEWLMHAIDAGAAEPLAVTLSTVDETGAPDSRVVMLKDVTRDFGLELATGAESTKSRQLAADPRCAMTFYWASVARAVRIRGEAVAGSREQAARDFLARHPDARAVALAELQSAPMTDPEHHTEMIAEQRARIDADPTLVSATWTLWRIHPKNVEFWQGAPTRDHLRLRYAQHAGTWHRERLWP
ncbi:pyridoxal 5'-phosphate synthase [Humibacter antri]